MRYKEEFIESNGIKLHVVSAGPKKGKPVILLHGFPEYWFGWRKQIPALTKAGYRVIVPDQRGYNLSDKPNGVKAYRLDTLVEDVQGLIDAFGYEKVHLIGHDWGAVVAWAIALLHPERIQKLGILNVPHPAVMNRFLRRDIRQMRRSWYILFFQIPWLPELMMRRDNFRNIARIMRGSSHKSFTKDDIAAYKEAWSQPGALTAMLNWYRALARYRPRYSKGLKVKPPTIMIWGMQDTALSHRMARPSIDYCENGRLVLFEDATHWVQHDVSEDVNQLLLEFIKG